jgi:hypothetical protein
MRSTLLLPCVLFASLSIVSGQQPLSAGPYGPADASSVVHVDLKAVRDSLLGEAIAKSAIGKAAAKFFAFVAGYEWTEIESLRLASVARAEKTALRDIWVLHARGTKALVMPARLAALGVDVLASKSSKKGVPSIGAIGFVRPAPREMVVGETAFLRERFAGKKVTATSPGEDKSPPYLLRAVIRMPRVGVAQVGTWTLPLFDAVNYYSDPLKKITVVLAREPRSGVLRLRVGFEFGKQASAYRLGDSLREKVARALRDRDYFNFWPALRDLRVGYWRVPKRSDILGLHLDFPDRRVLDAALGGYAPLAAVLDLLSKQLEGFSKLSEEESIQMEPPVEEVEEEIESDEKKQKIKKKDEGRKGKKNGDPD